MTTEELRKTLGALVADLAQTNCALWHEEDKARVDDDLQVARAKRAIDKLNQSRNDLIERIDDLVLSFAQNREQREPKDGASRG